MTNQKFQDAIDEMDKLNSRDPNNTTINGRDEPEALVYARAMTQTLNELYPDASTALKLAVRAQHIERWKIPRSDYPQDRAGYHRWRNDLKIRHAKTASKILQQGGFDEQFIKTVRDLITKKNIRSQKEAQALEDVACIVFFENYAEEFASKHSSQKVTRIIEKTLQKMSQHAILHAKQLKLAQVLKTQINKPVDGA